MMDKEIYLKLKLFEDGSILPQVVNDEIRRLKIEAESKNIPDELLSPEEAAKFLKLPNKKRLNDLRLQGKLPISCYKKIDGIGYRYIKRELYKFVGLNYE